LIGYYPLPEHFKTVAINEDQIMEQKLVSIKRELETMSKEFIVDILQPNLKFSRKKFISQINHFIGEQIDVVSDEDEFERETRTNLFETVQQPDRAIGRSSLKGAKIKSLQFAQYKSNPFPSLKKKPKGLTFKIK
jgi:hypothetical protein